MKFTLVVLSTFTVAAFSKSPLIVYGTDDREETHEASSINQRLAYSTAGMFKKYKSINFGDKTMLNPRMFKDSMNLCPGERFENQSNPMSCSAFLVGSDLMVTAGHCVKNNFDCSQVAFTFDYELNSKTNRANTIIENKKIYNCRSVIEAKREVMPDGEVIDYALIRLDRPVLNRLPLSFRKSGKISDAQNLVMIGHPSGLPKKVTAGGRVVSNNDKNTFTTNLDAFGGNSGSPVFNERSSTIEGILVSGAKDYIKIPYLGCNKVNRGPEDFVIDSELYGEKVTRITMIKSLMKRRELLAAARTKNIDTFKAIADTLPTPNLHDDRLNTALHFAAANNHTQLIKYLLDRGANKADKNLIGKTAYNIAQETGSYEAILLLK